MGQITELLERMQAGDEAARDALFASTYDELRRLARSRLRDGGRNTVLETTSLVHESYLRFLRVKQLRTEDRRGFFAYAARACMKLLPLPLAGEGWGEGRTGSLPRIPSLTTTPQELRRP